LKGIKSYPFIYWISDEFREKFGLETIDDIFDVRQGIATGNNNRFVRFWWELNASSLSNEVEDEKKWKIYSKGGPYKKWYGNLWLRIAYDDKNRYLLENSGNHLPSREYYFREGVTYSGSGSKGTSFRYFPQNGLFDVGGSCLFTTELFENPYYLLAF
jgi:hypothetical protein